MTEQTTTIWTPDASETVDLGGTAPRRTPPADPHRSARAALTAAMGQLEELYRHAVPLVGQVDVCEAWDVTKQIQDIVDALGRIKIGLLPRS